MKEGKAKTRRKRRGDDEAQLYARVQRVNKAWADKKADAERLSLSQLIDRMLTAARMESAS